MYASNIARTRYTGLASGVDIDSLVSASLQMYYTRIDAADKQKILNEWKEEAYRDMNTKITDFKNKYFSMSSSSNLISTANMQAKSATITDNEYVKVTATSSADVDTHTITDVNVATKASATSSKLYVESGTIGNKTLAEVADMFKDQGGSFADANDDGSYTVKLNVNGKEVEKTFSADTKISDFLSEINNSGIEGKLTFNELSRKFELKTTNTGKDQAVSISGAMFGNDTVSGKGVNASVTIDGEKHESSANSFTVGGLKFDVLGTAPKNTVTDENGITTEESTLNLSVSVKKDTAGIVSRIKSFVEDYNSLISNINTEVSTIKSSSYLPLTDDEKADMEEADIEEWTKKAKQGLFYNDSTLKSLVSNMRSLFSQNDVGDSGLSFSQIGIKTGTYETKGQLVIDETKLTEALENNPDEVMEMFSGTNGLSDQFTKALDNAISTIKDIKIAGFSKKVTSYEDKIDELYDILEQKEDALYDRYAQMESTISKLQSQMNSLGMS